MNGFAEMGEWFASLDISFAVVGMFFSAGWIFQTFLMMLDHSNGRLERDPYPIHLFSWFSFFLFGSLWQLS